MKSEKGEKVTRVLLSLVCFTAYIFLFIAVITQAFNTDSSLSSLSLLG